MFYLILAIFSSVCIGTIMRMSTQYVKNQSTLLLMNYVICILLASELKVSNLLFSDPKVFYIAVINGIIYLAGFVLLQYNVRLNGLSYSSIFQRLGVLLCVVLSVIVYKEVPTAFQVIGIVIAVAAIIYINEPNGSIASFNTLLLMFCIGGIGDFISKIFVELGIDVNSNNFLFYTFLFAFISCALLVLFKKEKVTKYEALFGMIIGIPNYFSAKFLLKSLMYLPGMVVYPTYSIATLMTTTIIGILVFKEKISKRSIISMIAMIIAVGLLNI